MSSDFAGETCLTCCKKPENFHKLSDSDGDSNPNICYIICQHFWFKEDGLQGAIVCETCWEKVDQFHQFYLDVKKQHEHREEAPLSVFIKQEEITIEETQLQENCIDISADNQKLFEATDCKHEITEKFDELPKKEKPAEAYPQPKKKIKYPRRPPIQRVVKRKNPHSHNLPTPVKRQAKDDFIKQHTRYICDECCIEFENFRAIKNHRIEAHNKNTVVCCDNHHRTRAELYEHVQSLLNPEAFKCEICGSTLKSKSKYVRHKEMYHAAEEDLVFKCNRCPKSFIKEGLLKSHLAEHETLENETAKCEFCGKCFRNKSSLNQHVKVAHKKPMDFICEVCSKGFYQRGMFLEHHKTHERTAQQLKKQCHVCNKWLKSNLILLQHMKNMHSPDKQLKEQCPDCKKWFSSHSNLLQHMLRHKGGECKCEMCDHVSINMMSLKMHMKSRHAPDRKRHACEHCGKEFSLAVKLKEHVAYAHSGEHLYQCQHCEKKFFFRHTMDYHRKKNHPKERLDDRVSKNVRRKKISDGCETVS